MALGTMAGYGVSSEKMTSTRPTWAEISRGRLVHNHDILRRLAGPETELLAVVKANAYGHGLAECARVLEANGARWFGVTSVEEGVALRRVCPEARIVIMAGLWHLEAEAAFEHRLTPVVWERVHLDLLDAAARKRNFKPAEFPVHLEIDTGMSRQGASIEQLELLLDRFGPGEPLRIEAVMTHFHSPQNEEATQKQERALAQAVEIIAKSGLRPEFLSAGSSAAVLRSGTSFVMNLARRIGARPMLRPGIALYGYAPSLESGAGLQPVLEWKTRAVSFRDIEPGTTVGYDATFTAQRRTRLALLPVGYADGLGRQLSNRGDVLIRGQRAPIAGRISMDHVTADVTDIPSADRGDEVVLIGQQDSERITADDLAHLQKTIAYEVLCDIGARVPRVMVE
jgi:alanine racemase